MPAPTLPPDPYDGVRNLDDLETPAALIDLARTRRNIERVAAYCATSGLRWRPHVKTHKTPALAAQQVGSGASGVTVATLRELEVMAPVVSDIVLAYPVIGAAKLRRLESLQGVTDLAVAVDSLAALDAIGGAAARMRRRIGVLIEIDVGAKRMGVRQPEHVVQLARHAGRCPWLTFDGILFYPGHIRSAMAAQDAELETLAAALAQHIEALGAAGLPPRVVSGGSTPTIWRSHELPGLTEVRAGTFIFNDRTTMALGVCQPHERAYTVLATVVSTEVAGQATIDAGSKALSSDVLRGHGTGYGELLDRPDVVVRALSEEHGMLDLSATDWRPRVGDRVRVVPNHVCTSVNLQEVLHCLDGDRIVNTLTVAGRGRRPAS
ncbi:MAG: D-serine deaminase, pyridoxal phosphate-dependent [Gemmatimonadetes bacterium]|nr:D-serine deaminase, pyridoxal phosphate-dependent [Gemmatimonadota bacterium]